MKNLFQPLRQAPAIVAYLIGISAIVLSGVVLDFAALRQGDPFIELFERRFLQSPTAFAFLLFASGIAYGMMRPKKDRFGAMVCAFTLPAFALINVYLHNFRSQHISLDVLYYLLFMLPFFMGARVSDTWRSPQVPS